MYKNFELKIIKCLKEKNSPNSIQLLQDPINKDYYFMGNGGQGTTIILKIKPKFENVISSLIKSKELIANEVYYSLEYNKRFTLYKFQEKVDTIV